MSVKVRIPSPLRSFTNGADVVEVIAENVGQALAALKDQAAGIETRLFKAPNQLNRFVNVYLNDEDIRYLKNLDTPVKSGDELSIVPAIAGGDDELDDKQGSTLTTEQITEFIRRLSPSQRRDVLLRFAAEAAAGRTIRQQKGEARLREMAAAQGRQWDSMTEQEREDFIDDLVHEDRQCR